ncbi:MAG TPA: ATP-binding protein, partial [Gemmatimonadaceae bacterium]
MTTPSDEDLLATFTRRLEQRKSAPAKTEQNAYHLAAAVLHVFDPTTLLPYWNDNTNPRSALQALIDDSAPAVGWRSERLRTLKVEARVAALERLATRQSMREALAANPGRRRTPLQELFEQWVNEVPIVPEELGYAQLSELKHLYEWRLERFGGLPDPDRAEDARLRRGAVAVFEHLVDHLFVGRQRELQMLRDHVGTVPPSRWEKFKSFLPSRSPALVVHGRGGAGKTALVGRFLLEHVNADNGWFPFAYLPFDSATLDV